MSYDPHVPLRELPVPPGAALPDSYEMLRIWSVAGGQRVVIDRTPEAGQWGIVLVDLLGHLANMYGGSNPLEVQRARERILALFEAELRDPTDIPEDISAQTWGDV